MALSQKSAPAFSKKPAPDPVDIHVGVKIKLRRSLLGISQERLANAINISFQQVQKYESGHNRVSASRLYAVARVLEVDLGFFFEGLASTSMKQQPIADPMRNPIYMRLVRAAQRQDPLAVDALLQFLERLRSAPVAADEQLKAAE